MAETPSANERIAKVMARAGVASRRDAERLILAGRVAVNGTVITSPALDVSAGDRVTLDGKPIDAPQATRLWLYYKPLGLVTSEKDERGRQTVFESLPDGMPRVMSVGRLDLNSEGLLLLTNDGALKRRLELPETGWLRKYRVRVNGRPTDETFAPLRAGVTLKAEDGTEETFLPMDITIDKQQGANAWLTVGLREGKNREIRRAMSEVGMVVNRLIRVSYGPFRLNLMKPGEVVEVKARVLRDQLGPLLTGERADEAPQRADRGPRPSRPDRKPFGKPSASAGDDRETRAPRKPRAEGEAPRSHDRKPRAAAGASSDRKPYGKSRAASGAADDRRPYGKPRASGGDDRETRAPRKPREMGEAPRSHDRKPRAAAGASGDRKPYGKPRAAADAGGERKPFGKPRPTGGFKSGGPQPGGPRKPGPGGKGGTGGTGGKGGPRRG
jgi:23S rRNA pseudouridine2605 synthase